MSLKNLLTKLFLTSTLLSSAVFAASPTAAQIEQFKRLPAAQQQALAKSMGVDLSALKMQAGAMQQQTQETEIVTPVVAREPELQVIESIDGEITELKAFGYDVFANAPSTFTPNLDIAVPESYVVGPGDNVSVQIFGKENLDYQLPVTREGQVVIPNLGPFNVVGLTYAEMKLFLGAKIQQRILGVNVVVSIASLRSMRVFVLGDAYKPGPYIINSLSSVTHALFAAGGISDIGSLRNIQVKRAGKLIQSFDLYDLLIQGDSSNDILLHAGDVVFVAAVGNRVSVDGEVRRAGIYEISNKETFADVIKMAGGLLPSSFPKATRVERYNDNNLRSVKNVDLANKADLAGLVKNGDAIHVLKTSDLFDQSIEVIGAVTRPGTYQWVQGQTINDIFPNFNAYLLAEADLNYSLIVREVDRARNIEVLQFKLSNAANNPESTDNIEIQARDRIIIFANTEMALSLNQKGDEIDAELLAQLKGKGVEQLDDEKDSKPIIIEKLKDNARFRLLAPVIQKLKQQGASGKPMQLIEVDGQVKYPGVYPLAKNSKVSYLIAAAGGITESAYLARAEITRNTVDYEKAGKVSINVNLKDALANTLDADIALQSKDRLNVHQIPSWTENHVVSLLGEFVFPGKYTIRRGETLDDVIKKAGGFTEYAFPQGGVFTRAKLKRLEVQNLKKLASDLRMEIASKSLTEGSNIAYAEAQSLLADLTEVKPVGRLVINLPKLVNDASYDVLLENGDALYVPSTKTSINVIGQVHVSTSHMYDASISVDDYILKSGGVKQRAETDDIYVIAANGDIKIINSSNWFSTGTKADLQPGDTIVVPLDSDYTNSLTLWSTATQILYNTAVAVAAINGI